MKYLASSLIAAMSCGVLIGMYVEPLSLALILSLLQGIAWGILGAHFSQH